jgi:hypothetical protein
MSAKVTAVQAAQAAETNVSGKVASVAFEGENGKPFYQVEVVTADGQQHSVAVDAATGEVTQMASNQEDEHSGQNGDENGQEKGGENEAGVTPVAVQATLYFLRKDNTVARCTETTTRRGGSTTALSVTCAELGKPAGK